MSSINTSINAFLASNFSEFNAAANTVVNGVANNAQRRDFSSALGSGIKPGTSVRAQYDYTVNEDGKLVQTSASITIGGDQQKRQQSAHYPPAQDERPQSFANIAKPRADLSPSDETQLFAVNAAAEYGVPGSGRPVILRNGAHDQNGDAVDVELITNDGDEPRNDAQTLAAQKQQRIASLYAKNSDVIYNVDPVLQFAA